MNVVLRRLGEHRGAPRLYLDGPCLQRAGFQPGQALELAIDSQELRVCIRVTSEAGSRRVSRKRRGGDDVPVIDINCTTTLGLFRAAGVVRVVIDAGVIHILLPAGVKRAAMRAARLASRIALGQPLRVAGVAFGAGIASQALHDGLAAGGVGATQTLAVELSEDYLDIALARSRAVGSGTVAAAVPMQEAAADAWLMHRAGQVDVLEAGIPCSGASRAGAAKRGLTRMEDHPTVGHLVGALIELVARLQPSIVFVENVVTYRATASAAILRGWLRDAGYAIHEVELDARSFGSLEARVRWFLVACPPDMPLELDDLRAEATGAGRYARLAEALDNVEADDPRWREVSYLKEKEGRDVQRGANFAMQWLTPNSTHVPTLRKGYHKGGSTDPRLVHPSDATLSRLLTGREHARIKGVDEALVHGLADTTAHQVCGQAVDVRPVQAIGSRLARSVVAWAREGRWQALGGSGGTSVALDATMASATG